MSGHDVESLYVSGSRVTMNLETPAMPGAVVTLSYAPGEKPIKNRSGVEAESFTNMPVNNIGKAPVLVVTRARGDQITLTYDEPLDEGSIPPSSSYTVTVEGASRTVSGVEVKRRESDADPGVDRGARRGCGAQLHTRQPSHRRPDKDSRRTHQGFRGKQPHFIASEQDRGTSDWLTRFGRSVASQAVEAIESRLKAPSMRQASSVTIAGQDVDFFDDDSSLPLAQDDPDFVSASRIASRTLGFGGLAQPEGTNSTGLAGNNSVVVDREISMSDLLLASSFHLTSTQTTETARTRCGRPGAGARGRDSSEMRTAPPSKAT